MNKAILFLLGFVLFSFAIYAAEDTGMNMQLYKDGYSNVQVLNWDVKNIQVIGYSLTPNEKYVLAYKEEKPIAKTKYGSSYTNFPYPKIKCIMQNLMTDESGSMSQTGIYNFNSIKNDKKMQKLFLIKSSEISCKSNRVFKWDESKYYISEDTI